AAVAGRWARDCERLAGLDRRLPQILDGTASPADPEEAAGFAELSYYKARYATAVRLYEGAFTARPALADDPGTGRRDRAGRAAALAGCGRGEEAATADDAQRARWRQQALDWLRAELTLWARQLSESKPPGRDAAQEALRRWQREPDLAGVREGA